MIRIKDKMTVEIKLREEEMVLVNPMKTNPVIVFRLTRPKIRIQTAFMITL